MEPKRTLNNKTVTIIILVVIAIIAAIPTVIKLFGGDFSWEQAATNLGVVGNAKLEKLPVNVHFVDVGQGNCTLVTSDYGVILIDCGEVDAKDAVCSYLDDLKIKKIDYLIATHPHSDHIGCMAQIVRNYKIGKFYMPELDDSDIPTTSCYEHLLMALDEKHVDASYMKYGDSFSLGELKCCALAPVKTIKGNLNSMSIILKIQYKNKSFLVTGDAETDEEKTVLDKKADLKADILLLGHHGSRTASSMSFLKAVDPEIAIISCGKDNSYGHPHKQTLQKLNKLGIEYYRTDKESTVIFGTDGNIIFDYQSGEEYE